MGTGGDPMTEWEITAVDTLFFRGPQPFVAGESVFVQSLFPPTPRTMQGMVRSALLEAHGVNYHAFKRGTCDVCEPEEQCAVMDVVGSPGAVGTLDLLGPYLLRDRDGRPERLYPIPGDLRIAATGGVFRLSPGPSVLCDAGLVRLPWGGPTRDRDLDRLPVQSWITESGLATYLAGGLPQQDEFACDDELLDGEPRVGLARDPATRAAREGLLYTIEPLRPRAGVRLGLRIAAGSNAAHLLSTISGLRRIGGEGRLAELRELTEDAGSPFLPPSDAGIEAIAATARLRMVLLQPADFEGSWLPRDFTEQTDDAGVVTWHGTIHGIGLTIFLSSGGSPSAIGGWNLAEEQPFALRPCVPAGTVYYCEVDQPFDAGDVVKALHNAKIGVDAAFGFGQIAVGAWPEALDAQ